MKPDPAQPYTIVEMPSVRVPLPSEARQQAKEMVERVLRPHVFGDVTLTRTEPAQYERKRDAPMTDAQIDQLVDELRAHPPRETDPLDRLVDGLSVRECLARYEAWQREDVQDKRFKNMKRLRDGYLNRAQTEAAQQAWSSALKAKQAEAKERERASVVCERDEDGE